MRIGCSEDGFSNFKGVRMRLRLQFALLFILMSVMYFLVFALNASAQTCPQCSKGKVNIPISLAVGNVRTPEFITKHTIYFIAIRSEWRLPTVVLRCKLGFGVVPPTDKCRAQAVLEADWKVLEGDRVVAQGHAGGISDEFEASEDYIARYIGDFQAESKHKYVVEVTFTKDGGSLDVTNPRLVVSPPDFAF
jgi:hypothetical protein